MDLPLGGWDTLWRKADLCVAEKAKSSVWLLIENLQHLAERLVLALLSGCCPPPALTAPTPANGGFGSRLLRHELGSFQQRSPPGPKCAEMLGFSLRLIAGSWVSLPAAQARLCLCFFSLPANWWLAAAALQQNMHPVPSLSLSQVSPQRGEELLPSSLGTSKLSVG